MLSASAKTNWAALATVLIWLTAATDAASAEPKKVVAMSTESSVTIYPAVVAEKTATINDRRNSLFGGSSPAGGFSALMLNCLWEQVIYIIIGKRQKLEKSES
jgi:hypothetical protein